MSINLPTRILALLLAVGAPLTFSACGDMNKETAAPVGAVWGEVLPAGSVTRVTATNTGGQRYEFAPTTQTAAFQLDKLPPGEYTLAFTTTASYNTPEPKRLTVRAGQTTMVPAFTLTSTGRYTGEVRWTLDGQQYTTTELFGEVKAEFLSVTGRLPQSTGNGYEEVALSISSSDGNPRTFRGVGTYPLGLSEWSTGRYLRKPNDDAPASYSTFQLGQPAGSVVITEFDPVQRKAAGTFSFTARGFLTTTGTRQITNGSFRFSY